MPSGYRTIINIEDMYKDNNINNKSISPNNKLKDAEGRKPFLYLTNHYKTHKIKTLISSINPFKWI